MANTKKGDPGIEPGLAAPKAAIMPLDQSPLLMYNIPVFVCLS